MAAAPPDRAARWTGRAPVQLLLLLVAVLAGTLLFPARLVLAPLGFALVLSALLFAAERWPRGFDRLFAASLPVPVWAAAAALLALAFSGALTVAERLTAETAAFALLTSLCLPWLVALAFDGNARRAASTRLRVPTWPLSVLSLLGLTGAFVFGGRLPSAFEAAVFAGFLVVSCIVAVVVPLTLAQVRGRPELDETFGGDAPFVSVLVPAYNESDYVGACVESILASDYPTDRMEVLVVDDGSTDGTYAEAAAYRDDDRVSVYHRANGGKHAALNFALSCSRGEFVVTVDADSVLDAGALRTAAAKLDANPELGAVAGTVVIDNPEGVVGGVQALEYVLGINTLRRAFSHLGSVMVVPGCLGVFRREALVGVGGYDPDTVTEDFDLTLSLLKAGWRVELSEGVVYTEAPFSVSDLLHQRLRWTRGNVQTLCKHRDVLWTPAYGSLHRFTFPLWACSLLLVPLAGALVTATLVGAALHGTLPAVALATGYFVVVLSLVAATALDVSGSDWRLLAYVPLHVVGYRQFLDFVVFRTLVGLLRGSTERWESVARARQEPSDAPSAGVRAPADD
ncbi:glycosyltransferase [Halogeometricum luteum]|uniref:Glycosyltransferase n=1 Tax=Halogeometricum luteum TaxID=2950537 RepID=A0ABU2G7E2_9EURY|nr:glycosyltransferase [Halogeometricum sp. S3BR5-2]MDS0296154.1 glycosyltransferase [Halogeometricum sp. S3BR5-2]